MTLWEKSCQIYSSVYSHFIMVNFQHQWQDASVCNNVFCDIIYNNISLISQSLSLCLPAWLQVQVRLRRSVSRRSPRSLQWEEQEDLPHRQGNTSCLLLLSQSVSSTQTSTGRELSTDLLTQMFVSLVEWREADKTGVRSYVIVSAEYKDSVQFKLRGCNN